MESVLCPLHSPNGAVLKWVLSYLQFVKYVSMFSSFAFLEQIENNPETSIQETERENTRLLGGNALFLHFVQEMQDPSNWPLVSNGFRLLCVFCRRIAFQWSCAWLLLSLLSDLPGAEIDKQNKKFLFCAFSLNTQRKITDVLFWANSCALCLSCWLLSGDVSFQTSHSGLLQHHTGNLTGSDNVRVSHNVWFHRWQET